jgi:uncharacterized membrane protein YgcG
VSGLNESARRLATAVQQRVEAVAQRDAALAELNTAKQSIIELIDKASTAVSERDAAVKQLKSQISTGETASTKNIWQRCKRCAECATNASVAAEKERADTLQQQLTDATAVNEQHVTAIDTLNCTLTEQAKTIASLTDTVTAVAATAAKWRKLSKWFAALALCSSAYADTLSVPYTQWQQFAISCVAALLLYVLMRKCCAIGIGEGRRRAQMQCNTKLNTAEIRLETVCIQRQKYKNLLKLARIDLYMAGVIAVDAIADGNGIDDDDLMQYNTVTDSSSENDIDADGGTANNSDSGNNGGSNSGSDDDSSNDSGSGSDSGNYSDH